MSNKIYWPIGMTKDMPGRTSRSELIEAALAGYCRHLFDDDTVVKIGWMEKTAGRTPGLMSSLYLGLLNDSYLIRDILRAEREGFDAATVGGHWDPGLWAAREVATVPVVGPGEAAMLAALALGARFAFLTVDEGYVPVIGRNIRLYGLESRAISRRPVRKFGMTYENLVQAIDGRSDEFLVELEKTALECIEDGADVIIAGGQLFGPVFQKHSFWTIPNTGVPVVEVTACALYAAHAQVQLRKKTNLRKSEHKNALFRTPPRDRVDEVLDAFKMR
jgi:allantoin racemase